MTHNICLLKQLFSDTVVFRSSCFQKQLFSKTAAFQNSCSQMTYNICLLKQLFSEIAVFVSNRRATASLLSRLADYFGCPSSCSHITTYIYICYISMLYICYIYVL